MRIILSVTAVLLMAVPVYARAGSVIYYLDGARIEKEAAVSRGYLEFQLPSNMVPGSLRARPLDSGSLEHVEIVPARINRKVESEIARIEEQKELIGDRLKALEVREAVFRSAAKSQSGKAPK